MALVTVERWISAIALRSNDYGNGKFYSKTLQAGIELGIAQSYHQKREEWNNS